MEINGLRFDKPHICVLVLPRGEEEIVFKAQAILSYDDFKRLCPMPVPLKKTLPGGEIKIDTDNKDYRDSVNFWASQKTHYMIVQSLKASDIKWDKVDYENPSTWGLYEEELRESFFSDNEINRITGIVWEANALDENALTEARKRFLARPVVA